jgi:hypothetical protein
MLAYTVILVMGAAGYANATAWLIPWGAACLVLDSWKPWRLNRQPRISWTSKTTTYFVTGVIADLGLAALGFGAGRLVRTLLG